MIEVPDAGKSCIRWYQLLCWF